MTGTGATTALASLLQRLEALHQDKTFGVVRDWKARTGGLAVGFMPVYVPRELLHAMGVLPVGVLGGGDSIEIIRGDAYYQSYICHLPRSTIELGLNGSLDCLDGMLFPATCDVIRNLSGMWMMQFPDKLVRYLDVPQDFAPDVGGAFYRHELLDIAGELARRGARPLDDAALRASIAVYDANRRAVESLYELRRREPWRVPSDELYLVMYAGMLLPVEEHTSLVEEYRAAVCADAARRPLDQARMLVTGSFCEQPPLGLIRTLERAGCYIVDDDFVAVHRWIRGDVLCAGESAAGDALDLLVRAYLEQGVPSAIRYIDDDRKGRDLVERVQRSGAEGVVFCAPSFCDPALLDQPMLVGALDAAGIPWTAFKYAENTGQFQVIREQAGTFADSIKLWSGAGA
ncbi:MAG: benzoyl-CoA reductase subunit C [Planctomycetes bacterium]|nr:benzoyl-CoA reductase subunit C [Planctomycetota bacterium]